MEGKSVDWDDIKNNDIDVIVTKERRNEILSQIGYRIDDHGNLIDEKSSKSAIAEDGLEINVNKEDKLSLISGTHNFVRNIAGFSQHLANKNALNIEKR